MKKLFNYLPIYLMAMSLFVFSCSDDTDDPTPNPAPDPVADFSFEVDDENPLMVTFTNESINHESSSWDFGDDNTSTDDNPSHTYAEGGTYTVTLTATNEDGETDETSQQVTVTAPGGGPATGENILAGGDMDDESAWTVFAGDSLMADYEFTEDGSLIFTGEAEGEFTYQTLVWQAIEITEPGDYLFSSHVEGGGFENAWIEMVLGSEEPEEGENYAHENTIAGGVNQENGKIAAINFWAGCGEDAFDGNIVEIGCDEDGLASAAAGDDSTNGIITFDEAGTYYMVIKVGNWNGTMGDGAIIHDISLAPLTEE